jgi:uncharacterized protein (DUF486 family)
MIKEDFHPGLASAIIRDKQTIGHPIPQSGLARMAFVKEPGKDDFKYNLFFLVVVFLLLSSVFQTLAWYYNLDAQYSFWLGFVISMAFVFFEYIFLLPANQVGFRMFNIVQVAMLAEILNWFVFILYVKYFRKDSSISSNSWLGLSIMFIGVLIAYM